MVARLRPADRMEIAAFYGDAWRALARSVENAERCYTGRMGGDLAAVWGVSRRGALSKTGHPWMVATEVAERRPAAFLRASRAAFFDLTAGFTRFENVVHADNRLARRWLRWIGFVEGEPVGAVIPFRMEF